MRKVIFLVMAMFGFFSLTASNNSNYDRYNDAVTFVERGVEFNVFLDGSFDYRPLYNNSYYNFYGNRRLPVIRNNFGRITRIGNTVINYGYYGNVIGIGNIPVNYRFGQLARVGNLVVEYDRWGYPHFRGFVRTNRFFNDGFVFSTNMGTVCSYNDPFFYGRSFRNNYRRFREDANFFYYRAIPNARLGTRGKIIKRRKPARAVVESNRRYLNNRIQNFNNNNRVTRDNNAVNRSNNTYRKPVSKTVTSRSKMVQTTPRNSRGITKKVTKTVTTRTNKNTGRTSNTRTSTNSRR